MANQTAGLDLGRRFLFQGYLDSPFTPLIQAFLFQAVQGRQDCLRVGQYTGSVGFPEANYPLLIYHQHRALAGAAFFIPDVVCLTDLAFGVPVG